MKILLLEDEVPQQVRVESHIQDIAREMEMGIEVTSTGKIQEFESYIHSSELHQLYFLDINIQGNDFGGLEVAQKIRELNPYAIIVFITTRSEFASITYRYKVSALEFIDKNLNEELFRTKIKECIEYVKTKILDNELLIDYFEYSFRDKTVKIPFKDILYIETTGTSHKLNLVGKEFQKEIAGSISDIREKDEEERFLSPHQSYLVNKQMIVEVDRKKKLLILQNGYSCPVSRTQMKIVGKIIEKN